MVEVHGEKMPLSGAGQVSLKNPTLFVVSPYDTAVSCAASPHHWPTAAFEVMRLELWRLQIQASRFQRADSGAGSWSPAVLFS